MSKSLIYVPGLAMPEYVVKQEKTAQGFNAKIGGAFRGDSYMTDMVALIQNKGATPADCRQALRWIQIPRAPQPKPTHRRTPAMGALWRVRDRHTFLELQHRGRRGRSGALSVTWLAGDDGTPPRVAYAVGRRVGPAVVRNRLRRRLRAAMAELAPSLPAGVYLVGAGPEALELTGSAIMASLSDSVRTATASAVAGASSTA